MAIWLQQPCLAILYLGSGVMLQGRASLHLGWSLCTTLLTSLLWQPVAGKREPREWQGQLRIISPGFLDDLTVLWLMGP